MGKYIITIVTFQKYDSKIISCKRVTLCFESLAHLAYRASRPIKQTRNSTDIQTNKKSNWAGQGVKASLI